MVKKKRVKMSTGQCVESHGHLTKKNGWGISGGAPIFKTSGVCSGGVRKVEALN